MASATVAELHCGVGRVEDATVAAAVEAWLDGMIRESRPNVVAFDAPAAVLLGRMWTMPTRSDLSANDPRSRKVKNAADLAIASVAIASAMIVSSADTADLFEKHAAFPLAGLRDPFSDLWAAGTIRA